MGWKETEQRDFRRLKDAKIKMREDRADIIKSQRERERYRKYRNSDKG